MNLENTREIKGKVFSIGKTYIILGTQGTGKIVYVPQPKEFKKDWVGKVYIYEHKSEYIEAIYGFKHPKSRELFMILLSTPGVGPKIALNSLKQGYKNLEVALKELDLILLTTIPGINHKLALAICKTYDQESKEALAETSEVKYVWAKSGNERPCVLRLEQAKESDMTEDGNVKGEWFNGNPGNDSMWTGETDFAEALIALDNDWDYRDAKEITKYEFDHYQSKTGGDFEFIKWGNKSELKQNDIPLTKEATR